MQVLRRSATIVALWTICVSIGAMAGYSQSIKDKVKDRIDKRRSDIGSRVIVGKGRYTINIDGDEREYFVHVPRTFEQADKLPVVFMLHGTSGDGEKFYNISGWKELGEKENILTVYPSSMRYCIIEGGRRKHTTKWNIYPGSFEFCKSETPRDDVKFLGTLIDEVIRRFKADSERVYFVGFSNGAQMTARVGIELSDKVAAVASSAGLLIGSGFQAPKRLLPNLVRLGSNDRAFISVAYGGSPAPMSFKELFDVSPLMKQALENYQRTYRLTPDYQTGGDSQKAVWLTDQGRSGKPENILRIELINGMDHLYPNKRNFPLSAAEEDWNWLKQYTLNGVHPTASVRK